MNKFEIQIDGEFHTIGEIADIPEFTQATNSDYSDFSLKDRTIDISFKLDSNCNYRKLSKLFYNLPRRKKKRTCGTKSARNKILKRSKLHLPLTLKHFKRAGMDARVIF